MAQVLLEREGRVAVIVIDNPPVNALSPGIAEGVLECFHAMERDEGIDAMVLIGAGRSFIAGADIRYFGTGVKRLAVGQRVADLIDLGTKPIVAAIHGYALGGGLEYALACHYRIARSDARLGLPEVLIGALPGGGGTQRLPRLIGPAAALEIILSGRHVPASEAHALGLVDALVEPDADLRQAALALARDVAARRPLPRVRDRSVATAGPAALAPLFHDAREALARRARHQQVPLNCLRAVEAGCTLPFEDGIREEARLFAELESTTEARALRYAFFAEREAAKLPDLPPDADVPAVQTLAVIGAGTMGRGIAMSAADAGLAVLLHDATPEALERGMQGIRRDYAISVERGRLTQAESARRIARIQPVAQLADVAHCDAVVEAVFEDLATKQQVFAQLDAVMKPQALLLSNTSALDVDRIAAATARPQNVAGAHFFSPAQVMKLLEVVRCDATSAATLQATVQLGRRLRKTCVVARNGEGFLTSRSRNPLTTEAMILLEEGALPEQIDRVMTDFGYPMGPFAVSDLVGLDIAYAVRRARAQADPSFRHLPVPDRLVEAGRLGQKAGAGWYRYAPGSRTPQVDPEVTALIAQEAERLGTGGHRFTDTDILHRLLFGAVNECCRILQEGRIYRASDIDVAWLHGFGFPRFRGGLMFWADTLGAAEIARQVSAWHAVLGPRWAPSPLLLHAARTGQPLREIKPMLQPLAID
jgi:3-hydroxyacyl-CoA dehydrogenase